MKFRSRVDLVFVLVTLFMIAVVVAPMFFLERSAFFWVYLAFGVVIVCWYIMFSFFNSYKFEDEYLLISSGPIKMKLNYSLILHTKEVKNLKMSFASSYSRLELSFGADRDSAWNKIYISPKDQNAFLDELKKRCKNLEN